MPHTSPRARRSMHGRGAERVADEAPPRRARIALTAALLAASIAAGGAHAQRDPGAFPSRVVTLVNPFAPGSNTDVVARLLAQKLAEAWGRPVVVENRPGASGNVGLAFVAKAPPDGHTLVMMIVSHATSAAMPSAAPALDLMRDFTHVSQIIAYPYVLLVNPSMPVRTVRELVALAKSRPGAITYGSSGVGSVLHLAGEMLAAQGKIKLHHVAYKGVGPALNDVVGGHIAMVFMTRSSVVIPLIKAGRVRELAVTSAERTPGAPDMPTMVEAGVPPPFEVSGWFGVSGPAAMPRALVERLNQDIHRAMKLPDMHEKMLTGGTFPTLGTPEQMTELVRSEVEKWRRVIQQAGIAPN